MTKNEQLVKKLQSAQIVTMEMNKALVSYAAGSFTVALSQIEEITTTNSDIALIKAACLAKLGRMDEALQSCKQIAATTQSVQDQLTLSMAQLSINDQKKYASSLSAYENSPAF